MISKFNLSLIIAVSALLLFSIDWTSTFSANAEKDNGGGNSNAGGNGNGGGNSNAGGNGNGGGNSNAGGNGNDNGNNDNKEKKKKNKDKKINKENYGKKSKNNISKKSQEKKIEGFDGLKPLKNKNKKFDTSISKLISSKDPQTFAKKKGFDYHDGTTRLMINMNELNDTIIDKIKTLATIEVSKGNQIQINIPANKISELSFIPEIKNIKSTLPAIQNRDIIIDGKVIEDSIFSSTETSGRPVSLAIIDLAFDEKNQKITNNIIESVSFRHIFDTSDPLLDENNERHGTAMAQIITSMLPNVKLHLLAAGTELEFINAMDYAISKNVDIITISYTWVNYDTDGTSPMTKKVEDAINSKITVVTPSGNYAENHWEGMFIDTDGDKWHEFSKSDEGMTFHVNYERIYEEKPILVYLKWDYNPESISDFDLTLMDPAGKIVDYSSSQQDQSSDEPIEYLYYLPEVPGEYYLGISNFGKPANAKLEIFSVYDKLEYSQSQGSVGVPSDAKGVVVTGSLGINNERQSYSSTGPTDNGLSVPNILSKDGIITQVYDEEPFHGTSSSAAYVSGLIAILYSEVQNVNPVNVTHLLYNNLLASQSIPNSDLQITGFAGKLSMTAKSTNVSDWYASLGQNTTSSYFPIELTRDNEKNSDITICKSDMVMILKKSTLNLTCVTKSTAELLIQRGWGTNMSN